MKMNFEYFQTQKWILQLDRKKQMIMVMVFPELWSLNCLKNVFLQFCADLSKKSKSVKAIYIYVTETSRYTLSENGIVYYAMTYCFADISVWSWRILLYFCWFSILFDILFANISRTVAQTTINHGAFWKSIMRTFRCIYVNYFNGLRFFAEVCTRL